MPHRSTTPPAPCPPGCRNTEGHGAPDAHGVLRRAHWLGHRHVLDVVLPDGSVVVCDRPAVGPVSWPVLDVDAVVAGFGGGAA